MRSADDDFAVLEARLTRALAWQPSTNALARFDSRVGAIAGRGRVRSWRRPILLVAAAVALMGAAITLTLVQQAASVTPGLKLAYDRGTVLNLSRSVDGYTVDA